MLQRQIMFKQLQELQRRQQLQELGNTRNQNYANQLSSLKHTLAGQFPTTVNGMPVRDSSRMLMVGNMQMMQHGEPSGLVFSQSHNHAVGTMGPSQQSDVSFYGAHTLNMDKNLNQFSHLQGLSNLSVDLLMKNSSSPLGMASVQPSAIGSSFMNQRCGFSSDRISMADGAWISSQEKDLFGRVPIEGYNSGALPMNYSEQGITMQRNASNMEFEGRCEDAALDRLSSGKISKHGQSEMADALDPLEQKILYDTDDNGWELSFGGSGKTRSGGFESMVEHASQMDALPSMQSGSWSALMQSALAETSSSDNGIQEEWSGLSFQNPEPLNDNQPQDFIDSEKLQNNWVDRNSQNAPSPSSNCFPSFQQFGHQYPKRREEYHSESSHATTQHSPRNTSPLANYSAQQKPPTGENQPIQASLPIILPCSDDESHNNFSGREFEGSFWLQGSTSYHVQGGIQKPSNQGMLNATSLSSHNVNDYMKNPCHTATEFPSYSAAASVDNSEPKIANSSVQEFPLLENVPVNQPSLTSNVLQHVGFPTGLPTPWQDIGTQQDASSPKLYKFSSNLFRSPDSASSSHDTSSGAPNEPHNLSPFQHGRDFSKYSGTSERLEKESLLHEGSTEVSNSTPLSLSQKQEFTRMDHLEVDAIGSGSLMTTMDPQPSNQVPARDIGLFGHSSSQNYSLLQQMHSTGTAESDGGKSFPPKHDNANYQQSIANARELLLGGQKFGARAKSEQNDQLGKSSSTGYHQNFQLMKMFSQNDMLTRPVGSNEASNLTYQSQIGMQMAPSWFKHYGAMKNGQTLQMHDPRALINAGNLQENSLGMQVNLANASEGSLAFKQLNLSSMLPSDVTNQNLAVPVSKKRKLVALDMIPWHKEVNHKQLRLQDISTAELAWTQALNRRQEEVTNEAEVVEELLPVIRAKRRLICTSQLMQQVFRPAPAVILRSDASSNCDYVIYFAVRLALGDACSPTGQLPSDTDDASLDKTKASKRTNACEFSKVVEGFISRVKKLEDDLSRLEKTLSLVDIKVESQELEKFSLINRFARFHIKAHPTTHASSSTSHKNNLQKYVVGLPMPKTVPEVIDCLSL
ncbi:hypothetical protein CDL12_28901 [Handroanthus impetiginosus]|uniref:Uncharacterized protein n=1 Tax=Handroanthus impetiginosus TaxID=429701 RepID=A0A2G9FZY3_9LAMI|nr:hypothetical protein CDL12_28901 [Handroanthus impetiginosus]